MLLYKICKYNSLIVLFYINRDFFIVYGIEIFFFINFGVKDLYIVLFVVIIL